MAKQTTIVVIGALRVKESSIEDFMWSVFNDAYAILFSVFFIEAYVVCTHLNCLDL